MGLSSGTKLGPYEIVSPLGAGGMGEVYRARDTRLDRTVAIKVLPESLQDNPELKARFDREARAISSLQHPHICALFDVGHQGGTSFLVMEYLDGETLAHRLLKGALPLDQVVKIGGELADALAKAHSQGILHRDVKPGNIMLTKTGSKLMDFGLAGGSGVWGKDLLSAAVSPLTPSTPTVDVSTLASAASPLTQKGTIVGTFQYLAPEVLQGKEADSRSDIFATGCVLYEMATGAQAFQGKTHLSVMSAILEKDPDPISALQPLTPVAIAGAIRTCLNKDPDDRWQTAADLRNVLSLVYDATPQPAITAVGKGISAKQALLAVLAALALMLLAFGVGSLRHVPVSPVLSSDLNLPAGTILDTLNDPMALSPDGKNLALALLQADGKSHLWLRRLDTGQMSAVEGTVGAEYAFWSPDGTSIGFFADGKLKRADLSALDLATGMRKPFSNSGAPAIAQHFAWSPNGKWLAFTSEATGNHWAIYRKATDGRTESKIVHVCERESCVATSWSPDGQLLALDESTVTGSDNDVEIVSVENGQKLHILPHATDGIFSPDGKWLAFYSDERGKHQVYVTAMPPGPEKWQVSSEEASVLSWRTPGTLLYGTTADKIAGVKVSANGKEFQVGPAEVKFGGRLFPSDITWDVTLDGKRAVTAVPTEAASGHSLKLLQNWAPAAKQ